MYINIIFSFQKNMHHSRKTPRVGLEPTTPRLTAVCSTIDTVTYRKISLIECYVQITIEAISFTLFGYHLTGDLTNNILT